MNQSDDKLLEDYLAGDSPISKQYAKEQQHIVPESMDDTILSAAKFSVRAKSKQQHKKPLFDRWQIPLSIAAVVVVSVSLVITLYDEYGQGYLDSPVQQSIPSDEFKPARKQELNDKDQMQGMDAYSDAIEEEIITAPAMEQQTEMEADASVADSPVLETATESPKPAKIQEEQAELRQQQMQALEKDVEELKKTQSTLLEERDAIKQSLDNIESKKSQLKNELDKNKTSEVNDTDIENELREVVDQWQQGNKDKAINLLKIYIQNNPSISNEQLQKNLPDDLWQDFLILK